MARRRYPLFVFATLVALGFLEVRSSEVNQVYALPPASMLHEEENPSAATNALHIVKPPEILLRNNLLNKANQGLNQSNSSHPIKQQQQQNHVRGKVPSRLPAIPLKPHRFPSSPVPILVPINSKGPTPSAPFAPFPTSVPSHMQQTPNNANNHHNTPFPLGPSFNNFPPSHVPAMNETAPTFHPDSDFNSFNEVERFLNFVPMDYENGQMPGFIAPHQKREARPANRRAGHGPPPRRSSNSTLKNIISSFHEKFSRILLGPRRRLPKTMRQTQINPHQSVQGGNPRFDARDEARNHKNDIIQTPTNDRSFTAALNTVAQLLQQNQYIPMLGKRERVRTLSEEETQHLDNLRRRDRKGNRRRHPRRRHPRKRRPHPRDRPPYEDDSPTKHHHDQPYHDEDEYHSKLNSHQFPMHFDDEIAPHKDHGPPYKSFKSFKSFKPWKPHFAQESYEDHEEHYRSGGHKGRKPAWYADSHEKASFKHSNHYEPHYHGRPHHHQKYREYSPDSHHDSDGFKSIKPFYGGFGHGHPKFKDWDEKKMKFHKVIDYDHGVLGVDHFGSKLKHGASMPAIIKDDDARIPKIIINHHHNLPPASGGPNFVPGPFPGNAVLSYSPPVHYHDDFYPGPPGSSRGPRNKKEYRTNEFADSFIVNDYGKPPIPGFGMPQSGFGVRPQIQHSGPPAGIASSPPMGGHMVFDHFAQNMPPHFMHAKLPTPNLNQVQFAPPAGAPVSFSNSNTHFPNKPMLVPGGHFPSNSPGFPTFGQHPGSADPFGKPSQMTSYNNDMHEHFPQSSPQGYGHEGGPGPTHLSPSGPSGPPPPDSSPYPSTNDHHDPARFIPPFAPVPREEHIPPGQGPFTPASRETFFKMNPPRTKSPRKFQLTIVKSLSSGFDIPEKLTNHPLAQPQPTPMMNYFDIGVPDREQYKKKQQRSGNKRNHNNVPNSREDLPNQQSSMPSLNQNKIESSEFNYSTLPENWRDFRPDPSHNKLPSLTHEASAGSAEIGSRMYNIRSALSPKSLMKALISRFPRARLINKNSRAHTKFTPFDAVDRSREDMGSTNRKRRKSTKTPASIQDIIDSDSSNHNKDIVVSLSEDELNNNSDQKDDHEGGASSSSPVVVLGKGRAKKPKSSRKGEEHISSEMQTEMPFNSEVDDEVLLGMHTIDIPVQAEMRMGEVEEKKKK